MFQEQDAFPSGNWYRGNLHCHSTHSDGKKTRSELAVLYRQAGYHFLCLSEHHLYTEPSAEAFLFLPGVETSAVWLSPEGDLTRYMGVCKTHHIGGILGPASSDDRAYRDGDAIPPLVCQGREWDGPAAARTLRTELERHGCFAIYNHPHWSHTEVEDYGEAGFSFLEIYNHNAWLDNASGLAVDQWDKLLRQGHRVYGVAADDNHNAPDLPDSCGGWVMVQAGELTQQAVTAALLVGRFYASTGPSVSHWCIRDGAAQLLCSPVREVRFFTGGMVGCGGIVRAPEEGQITQASYPLGPRDGGWIRAECVAADGTTAWTQPLFEEVNR